jgi:hypothetical protein
MFDETKELPLANGLMKIPSLCREFQAQPEEILLGNWHESGCVGHEAGFERALADWLIKRRSSWRKGWQPQTQPDGLSTF